MLKYLQHRIAAMHMSGHVYDTSETLSGKYRVLKIFQYREHRAPWHLVGLNSSKEK